MEQTLKDLPAWLAVFARNPVGVMTRPLRLTWAALLSLQIGAAMVSGAVSGLLTKNFWDFVTGLVLFPITMIAISFVFSLFLYHFFSIFLGTPLDYRRLHSIVVAATLPYFLLHIVAGVLPAIDVIGFTVTTVLLITGLVEQFGLPRKIVIRLMMVVYAAFLIVWALALIQMSATN